MFKAPPVGVGVYVALLKSRGREGRKENGHLPLLLLVVLVVLVLLVLLLP